MQMIVLYTVVGVGLRKQAGAYTFSANGVTGADIRPAKVRTLAFN